MPSKPTFPREYLLRCYNAAYEQGAILLTPIGEEDSISFTQAFYRLRRRADSSNSSFILPAFHLITVGNWRIGADGQGELPIYYNKQLEGDASLPEIQALPSDESGEEQTYLPYTRNTPPLDEDLVNTEFDADSYVEQLMKQADINKDKHRG